MRLLVQDPFKAVKDVLTHVRHHHSPLLHTPSAGIHSVGPRMLHTAWQNSTTHSNAGGRKVWSHKTRNRQACGEHHPGSMLSLLQGSRQAGCAMRSNKAGSQQYMLEGMLLVQASVCDVAGSEADHHHHHYKQMPLTKSTMWGCHRLEWMATSRSTCGCYTQPCMYTFPPCEWMGNQRSGCAPRATF